MSKRAEQAALKAYPYDYPEREGYKKGYERAEKDTIERAIAWLKDYVRYFELYDEKGVEEFKKAMEGE